jgi:DNA ligase-1
MKRFATLFDRLEQTNSTNRKVVFLAEYFSDAPDRDKLWAIALLSHKRPRRTVTTTLLREWAAESSGVPLWLFEESYHIVGDLAETIALLSPSSAAPSGATLSDRITELTDLRDKEEAEKKQYILNTWSSMTYSEKFVFNKLITGGFRIGISRKLMVRALSKSTGQEENTLMHKIMGNWDPKSTTYKALILDDSVKAESSKPYPFYLAYQFEEDLASLGTVGDWQAERKWDGIRGQLVKRDNAVYLWSRGEDLVTDKFPEFEEFSGCLDDGTVLDGEILPWKDSRPMGFQHLQKRIGRKNVSQKLRADIPVVLMAYDILEHEGRDIREMPLAERRTLLESVVVRAGHPRLLLSPLVHADSWQALAAERAASRKHRAEGLMLKRLGGAYGTGRRKGDWWKWKIDPLTVDAVMIYAMRGHGRRANLYTDYTFAVWDGNRLVPFAKAYSGLTDEEFNAVDRFVKQNTLERFGPVRSVRPELVFEIAFEGIAESKRHKSGIALRFPRMKRWRRDKPASEANTLNDLKELLKLYGG